MHPTATAGLMAPACLLVVMLAVALGEESAQPALASIADHPQAQSPLAQTFEEDEEEKRAWRDLQSSWGKRGWQDMPSAGWGKRGWQDMPSAGWGKRGWQDMPSAGWGKRGWKDLPSSGWGKRGWRDMPSAGWGKRGWQDLQGGWGKRSYPEFEDEDLNDLMEEDKRAWSSLKGTWGKRAADWGSFRGGSWGKRDPAWQNLKGLWGKRSVGDVLSSHSGLKDITQDLSRED
ncbi:myoinhibiting peptide precursor [Lycorma delicatula]|uniref:myoinhibiting peptide precursor n=1 Tax=Lycorma delicatula TaxID=130591 RepID=UPI003F5124C3